MSHAMRFASICSLGLSLVSSAACNDGAVTTRPGAGVPWSPTPTVQPKPDVVYSGSYGHVPGRVAVSLPSIGAAKDPVASLRAATATTATCPETSIMHDQVAPTIHQLRTFQHLIFLTLPILDIYVEAARALSLDPSGRVFVPAGAFGVELSQELLDAIQSRFDVPVEQFLPSLGTWFVSPAFCFVRDLTDELQTSIYVDRAGAAGVESCDDLAAFPEYFRWSDDLTKFGARAFVRWGDFPWDGDWNPTLADLFRAPTGAPVTYSYDALTDTQRLVVAASGPFGHVSQARGCGPDRCVELNIGVRELMPGGVYPDQFLGGIIENDVNRYTYLAGKANDHASAFLVRYHSAEDFTWQQVGDQPYTLHVKDRVLERHAALFDGAGCLVAYCAPMPANLADCYWQRDAANADLAVPSLPFYDDAIAHEVALNPFRLTFDVPDFPSALDEPWAEFVVVRPGGDPSRSEDLLADGSADFDGAPFIDVIAWGAREAYAGAEVWRMAPVATPTGQSAIARERMPGTVSIGDP